MATAFEPTTGSILGIEILDDVKIIIVCFLAFWIPIMAYKIPSRQLSKDLRTCVMAISIIVFSGQCIWSIARLFEIVSLSELHGMSTELRKTLTLNFWIVLTLLFVYPIVLFSSWFYYGIWRESKDENSKAAQIVARVRGLKGYIFRSGTSDDSQAGFNNKQVGSNNFTDDKAAE